MKGNLMIIIDSGLDMKNRQLMNHIIGGCSFEYSFKENKVIKSDNFQDEFSIGTNCLDYILYNNPQFDFYIIKILRQFNMHVDELILNALIECTKISADIIYVGLSIGSSILSFRDKMEDICNTLRKQGKILCVTDNSTEKNAIPATFKNVVGVRAKLADESKFIYIDKRAAIQIEADGSPIFVEGLNNRYNFYQGNPKANALVAATIPRYMRNNSKNEIEDILNRMMTRIEPINGKIQKIYRDYNLAPYLMKVKESIEKVISKNIEVEGNWNIFDKKVGINYFSFYDLIVMLYAEYNITNYDFHEINFRHVNTFWGLSSHLAEKMKEQ